MKDIVTIGEILIDLTQTGLTEQGIPVYNANPGGAPANLAVAASKLGADTAFIGKVGRDSYGDFLKDVLSRYNVDISGIVTDEREHTTLAIVSVSESGERSFTFYRNPSADVNLKLSDIPPELIQNTKYLHFGSVSLTADPCRSATITAVKAAKAAGAVISYDPNYRANLWENEETAVAQMKSVLPLCDVLKLSDEELPLITGSRDPEEGSRILSDMGIKLIFITLGADGSFFRYGDITGKVAGVPCHVADTNGAGDTFFGAALSRLCREDLEHLTEEKLREITAFANKAASITTSRSGAIPAMPTAEEMR